MTTKTILTTLLLASFFSLSAQDVASYDTKYQQFAFESVSFSSEQGSITLPCKDVENLAYFEITGSNAHFIFEWGVETPADRFPMKLGIKPGKVTIKYIKHGEKNKPIELDLGADDQVKLAL